MNTKIENPKPETWTAFDVARTYGVSRRCVSNWLRARIIPCIRVGRVLRFHPDRVREAMAKFEQKEITR